jgi:hypothetical protein
VEAKVYTSGNKGIYKWKQRYIQVVARVYTSGGYGIYKWKLRNIQVVEAKVYIYK